jgi:hypothetical protein
MHAYLFFTYSSVTHGTCCVNWKAYPWFATLPNTTQQLEHTVHAPDYLDYLGRGKDWTGAYADNVKQLNLRLRRLVHQAMADIIDPSRCAILLVC